MSKINNEIEYILDQARQEREKTASSEENGFSSGEEPSTITSEIAAQLKEAASKIKTHGAGIDARSVVDFIQELR